MRSRIAIVAGVVLAAGVAGTSALGTDYQADAGPAVAALARGDLAGYVHSEPQMGPLSLVLRAPAAAAAPDRLWAYRVGALLCLLVLVAFALWLCRSGPRAAAPVALAGLVLGGPTLDAMHLGHPEGFVLAAFVVGGVLLAPRRPTLAALALGAALATKQTGLIAVAPVLLATPREARVRVGAIAAGIAAAFYLPPALAAPDAFFGALRHPAFGLAALRTGNVWLPFAESHHVALGGGSSTVAYVVPHWLMKTAHPAIALVTVGGAALLAWRRRGIDPLVLLAMAFLLRCALDPWDHAYYHVTFVAALAAWEVRRCHRAPVLAALSAAWLGLVFRLPVAAADAAYVAWAVPLAAFLARELVARGQTFSTSLPLFAPVNSMVSVSGNVSNPSTTSSRAVMRPSRSQSAI